MISKLLAWWWLHWNPQCKVPGCEEFLTWEGVCRKHYDEARKLKRSEMLATVRQSSSLTEPGPESAHSGKQNTADKSELLPTQLPKEK